MGLINLLKEKVKIGKSGNEDIYIYKENDGKIKVYDFVGFCLIIFLIVISLK